MKVGKSVSGSVSRYIRTSVNETIHDIVLIESKTSAWHPVYNLIEVPVWISINSLNQ